MNRVGALYTTIDDLSRFLVLQLGHGPASVVPPARLDSAFNAVLGPDGKPATPFGIGFGVERKGGHNFYGHNGDVAGFSALLEFDRDRQVGIIVLKDHGSLGEHVRLTAERSGASDASEHPLS